MAGEEGMEEFVVGVALALIAECGDGSWHEALWAGGGALLSRSSDGNWHLTLSSFPCRATSCDDGDPRAIGEFLWSLGLREIPRFGPLR